MGILVITLLTLAGLKLYVPFAEGKSKVLADTVNAADDKLIGLKSLERIMDLQKRTTEIKSNLQLKDSAVTRLEMTDLLDKLGGDLNPGVVVSDFKYDVDNVTVSFDANNFGDVAKQILNFKKSEFFNDVNISSISRKENTISCTVVMKVKK